MDCAGRWATPDLPWCHRSHANGNSTRKETVIHISDQEYFRSCIARERRPAPDRQPSPAKVDVRLARLRTVDGRAGHRRREGAELSAGAWQARPAAPGLRKRSSVATAEPIAKAGISMKCLVTTVWSRQRFSAQRCGQLIFIFDIDPCSIGNSGDWVNSSQFVESGIP